MDKVKEILRLNSHKGALRQWEQASRQANTADPASLRKLRNQARQLRRRIDEVVHIAEARLCLPMIGANAISKPKHTDWAFRPEIWRGPIFPAGVAAAESHTKLGQSVTLFHDCSVSELTLRQARNTRESDLAPFGLRMDIFQFDGSFLSLVLDLPDEAVAGLRRSHVIQLDTVIEIEKPLEIFARLNVKHGPNVEQVVRELHRFDDKAVVEFDLASTNINEKRLERVWLDIIFEGPEMNEVYIRDATLTRRPRADF